MTVPSVSSVLPVFNGERYVAESLTAILSQTRPPEEVVVVDDGSTDGTQDELAPFRRHIRVIKQPNQGHPGAMNRLFAEARCDYVAKCDADDIWEPDKLERQLEAVGAHPDVDIVLTGARFFGLVEAERVSFPDPGILERRELGRRLYTRNFVCASSPLIRRELYTRLGAFDETLACEDYDFWLRAFAAGAVFYYDPRLLVRYRVHPAQVSQDELRMREHVHVVHQRHAGVAANARVVRRTLADDLLEIARLLVDQERPRRARTLLLSSLRQWPTVRASAWVLVLSTPGQLRRPLGDRLVSLKRTLISAAAR
jgi:glycosyltransferase involved in cell wall biosynthesis